jgi:hypothetical protein
MLELEQIRSKKAEILKKTPNFILNYDSKWLILVRKLYRK